FYHIFTVHHFSILILFFFFLIIPPPPQSPPFPYTTLFRSAVTAIKTASGQLTVTFTPGSNNGATATSYTATCTSTNDGTTRTRTDRKSTRLNSSHSQISYAVFCLKKKKQQKKKKQKYTKIK